MNNISFLINHDLHIHSQLSSCCGDPEQTTARILRYAEDNDFTDICLTDHYWDEDVPGASKWYMPQNTPHLMKALPLPQSDRVRFRFGCETEMDMRGTIGISEKRMELFDFIIIPTTHLHMAGFTINGDADVAERADAWVNRLDSVLNRDLPFEKIGIAHLTCALMAGKRPAFSHIDVLRLISDETMRELFTLAAKREVGIELNFNVAKYDEETLDEMFRPYQIAKACGCKFYLGSDAHGIDQLLAAKENFRRIVARLGLTEEDRFSF
ncbi:MAG: hypothetical protein IJZ85_07250 [Lachnospiraceae bacterium]|nr:hypothetical protein [Lachnospiraceae bacterium]